jgi:hypothetical protein
LQICSLEDKNFFDILKNETGQGVAETWPNKKWSQLQGDQKKMDPLLFLLYLGEDSTDQSEIMTTSTSLYNLVQVKFFC